MGSITKIKQRRQVVSGINLQHADFRHKISGHPDQGGCSHALQNCASTSPSFEGRTCLHSQSSQSADTRTKPLTKG